MADITPAQVFSGIEYVTAGGAVTANSVVIPLTDLPALDASEADPSTGDGREVIHALYSASYDAIQALDPANRPTQMTLTKGTIQGQSATEYRVPYGATFDFSDASGSGSLASES